MRIYCRFLWDSGQDITLLWVLSFGVGWRCSAGSQIFFLDKTSETCQKKLLLRRNIFSHNKIEKFTKATKTWIYSRFYVIWYTISRYSEFWVLGSDEGALRGPRYFSLTKHLRLVKKNCCSAEISSLTIKSKNSQKPLKHAFISRFYVIWYTISRYSEFWVLGSDEGALRGPRYFSLTKHLRLVKNISAQQKYLLPQ